MNKTIRPAPVRRCVLVQASADRAFDVFTSRMGHWWPKTHRIGKAPPQTWIIEPREGGRWFERDVDGTECDIGRVLAWEPPQRLVLSWQLSPQFQFDRDLVTEVELRFIAEGVRATRVELEHRLLERYGEQMQAMRSRIDSPNGWTAVLEQFARSAGEEPHPTSQ